LSPYAFIGQHPELGTVALPESTGTNNAVNPPATWVLRTDPRPPITDRKALCQDPLFCTCPEEGPCSIGYVIR
ncbi:MAG: hypothetical protein FJ098_15920, partial [Deltaproteobacteria bacterium]|nr:hypothetical protein [Deltaproteobacteria bacterium]